MCDESDKLEEKLIDLVQERPVLFDKTDVGYKNDEQKNTVRKEIGKQLNIKGPEAKKKWESVRAQFATYLRKTTLPTGSATNPPTKFRHSDRMRFLKDFVRPRKTSTNFVPEQTGTASEDEELPDILDIVVHSEGNRVQEFQLPVSNKRACDTSITQPKKKNQQRQSEFETAMIGTLENLKTKNEHELFLLSLVPAFERIGDRRKVAEIKLKIHQLIFDAEFSEI